METARPKRFCAAVAGMAALVGTSLLQQPAMGISPQDASPAAIGTQAAAARGYWLAASDGGIFSFGDARFFGSTGNIRLNRPIVAMAATTTAKGYWLVAADGGIFSFGDAGFHGSLGDIRLSAPVVGIAPTRSDGGYILASSDGGAFEFGDASFAGSAAGVALNPIVAVVSAR